MSNPTHRRTFWQDFIRVLAQAGGTLHESWWTVGMHKFQNVNTRKLIREKYKWAIMYGAKSRSFTLTEEGWEYYWEYLSCTEADVYEWILRRTDLSRLYYTIPPKIDNLRLLSLKKKHPKLITKKFLTGKCPKKYRGMLGNLSTRVGRYIQTRDYWAWEVFKKCMAGHWHHNLYPSHIARQIGLIPKGSKLSASYYSYI